MWPRAFYIYNLGNRSFTGTLILIHTTRGPEAGKHVSEGNIRKEDATYPRLHPFVEAFAIICFADLRYKDRLEIYVYMAEREWNDAHNSNP